MRSVVFMELGMKRLGEKGLLNASLQIPSERYEGVHCAAILSVYVVLVPADIFQIGLKQSDLDFMPDLWSVSVVNVLIDVFLKVSALEIYSGVSEVFVDVF